MEVARMPTVTPEAWLLQSWCQRGGTTTSDLATLSHTSTSSNDHVSCAACGAQDPGNLEGDLQGLQPFLT